MKNKLFCFILSLCVLLTNFTTVYTYADELDYLKKVNLTSEDVPVDSDLYYDLLEIENSIPKSTEREIYINLFDYDGNFLSDTDFQITMKNIGNADIPKVVVGCSLYNSDGGRILSGNRVQYNMGINSTNYEKFYAYNLSYAVCNFTITYGDGKVSNKSATYTKKK